MDTIEVFIWSAMTGALFLILLAVLGDWLLGRNEGALRNVLFVSFTGMMVVMMTGLPEHLWQISDPQYLLPLKVSVSVLVCAFGLSNLAYWLGIGHEDALVGYLAKWGTNLCAVYGIALFIWTDANAPSDHWYVYLASGIACMMVAVLGLVITLRAAQLGDTLALKMSGACICLGIFIFTLYAENMRYVNGVLVACVTSLAVMLYYLIVITLTVRRVTQYRKLDRLAHGMASNDPVTDLPIGAVLVSKVDDALWRATRHARGSMVMAIWIGNLYALGESVGREVEQEIRLILTARLRRTVGFRHAVGLYHPRCFLVAIAATREASVVQGLAMKSYQTMSAPMIVGTAIGKPYKFTPDLGVAIVRVSPQGAMATQVMDQAERLAQQAQASQAQVLQADYTNDIMSQFSAQPAMH